jgi:hypothetical protein
MAEDPAFHRLAMLYRHALVCATTDDSPYARVLFDEGHEKDALRAQEALFEDLPAENPTMMKDKQLQQQVTTKIRLDVPFPPDAGVTHTGAEYPGIYIPVDSAAYRFLQRPQDPVRRHPVVCIQGKQEADCLPEIEVALKEHKGRKILGHIENAQLS